MQLIYGMGGDSWSEVIDRFIEMPLWVVRVYTHFSLKRAVRWLSLIVCVFVRTVYQFCVYVQTWVKQNLHTIHSDRFKECKMTGKQHTEKLNARQGNCIFARDLHPGLPLCYCCLCCPWENHLHFLLLMVIFNHAQCFTAEAWKYFSLDIINFISHNDCIAKENTYQMWSTFFFHEDLYLL